MKKILLSRSLIVGVLLSVAGTAWADFFINPIETTPTVPDSGSSALLLGVAVVALGLVRKFRR